MAGDPTTDFHSPSLDRGTASRKTITKKTTVKKAAKKPVVKKAAESPAENDSFPLKDIDPAKLNKTQIDTITDIVAKITDLDSSIIKACNFTKVELVDTFKQATHYHDEHVKNYKKLQGMSVNVLCDDFNEKIKRVPVSSEFRTGGDWPRSVRIKNGAVQAVKMKAEVDQAFAKQSLDAVRLRAEMDHYDQSLTRMTMRITTRAMLQHNKGPR